MTENIKLYTQNSIRIETEAGVVYIDPFQLRDEPHDAVLILITHDHFDHFSPEDIQKAACGKTILVVPEKMKKDAGKAAGPVKEIRTVLPENSYEMNGLSFETVPAYNSLKPFHPKGAGWVGYILLAGGKRIYIAGDTDIVKEIKQVKCDIAMVPIGGTYTMDARQAAQLINTLSPEIAIPTHYGSIVGKAADAEVFQREVKPPTRVEIIKKY